MILSLVGGDGRCSLPTHSRVTQISFVKKYKNRIEERRVTYIDTLRDSGVYNDFSGDPEFCRYVHRDHRGCYRDCSQSGTKREWYRYMWI